MSARYECRASVDQSGRQSTALGDSVSCLCNLQTKSSWSDMCTWFGLVGFIAYQPL